MKNKYEKIKQNVGKNNQTCQTGRFLAVPKMKREKKLEQGKK